MAIPRYCWWLPRPRQNKYKGGFPLHFEKKLLDLLKMDYKTDSILHPFGGMAEYGIRVDINPNISPDYIMDAHNLGFTDDSFDLVILDPPYNDDYSAKLYNTSKLKPSKYIQEAVRVTKPNGFIVHYHYYLAPRPEGTRWYSVIVIITRVYHKARICSIFKKV